MTGTFHVRRMPHFTLPCSPIAARLQNSDGGFGISATVSGCISTPFLRSRVGLEELKYTQSLVLSVVSCLERIWKRYSHSHIGSRFSYRDLWRCEDVVHTYLVRWELHCDIGGSQVYPGDVVKLGFGSPWHQSM